MAWAAIRDIMDDPLLPPEDGERVRRAVVGRTRGWHHLHALRSTSVLWAWLLRQLMDLPASLVIENGHGRPPSEFAELAGGFTFGTVSDPAISLSLPDILRAGTAPAPRRLMRVIPLSAPRPPAEPDSVWRQWLSRIRSGERE